MEEYIAISLATGFALFIIATVWTVFEKAGRKGWEALIPFYNLYVVSKIIGKSGWFMLLYFVPIVSWFAWAVTAIEMSKKFGRSEAFGFGLLFLTPIFLPILAWGEASPLAEADLPVTKHEDEDDNTFVNEDGETIETIPVEDWDA